MIKSFEAPARGSQFTSSFHSKGAAEAAEAAEYNAAEAAMDGAAEASNFSPQALPVKNMRHDLEWEQLNKKNGFNAF